MAYITPKTDWTSDDGVTETALNRIEGNILAIGDQSKKIHVSGAYDTNRGAVVSETGEIYQGFYVTVPAGYKLYIVRARYHLIDATDSGDLKLTISNETAGTTIHTFSTDDSKDDLDLVATPLLIASASMSIGIGIYNISTTDNRTPLGSSGWAIEFELIAD